MVLEMAVGRALPGARARWAGAVVSAVVEYQETAADVIFRKLVVDEAHRRVVEAVQRDENEWQAAARGVAYLEEKFEGIGPDIAGDLWEVFFDIARKVREEVPTAVNAGAPL
jgi:hypothetical protein